MAYIGYALIVLSSLYIYDVHDKIDKSGLSGHQP